MAFSMTWLAETTERRGTTLPQDATSGRDGEELTRFRELFYGCLPRRADALFELCDAVLCADGPVTSLVGLSLAAEHRRGHGALYDAVNHGRRGGSTAKGACRPDAAA